MYRVIDAVPRPDINLEFRDAAGKVSMLTRVAVKQAINSNLNPGTSSQILQRVDSVTELTCSFDAHKPIVAYGLRPSRPQSDIQRGCRKNSPSETNAYRKRCQTR